MNEYLILTVIADDRPGLVDTLSRTIAEHDGSWLESRMSRLAGKFAGVLRIEVASERSDALEAALHALSSEGFHLQLERSPDPGAVEAPRELILEVVGHDRPGIVAALSRTLAVHRVNVESLETERKNAAMSGESLFQAKARIHMPADLDEEQLRRALEAIAGDLMVDLRMGAEAKPA
ncbi:MAG: ACT domain-containing protein [Candidatus Eisenbacteria bacterium]